MCDFNIPNNMHGPILKQCYNIKYVLVDIDDNLRSNFIYLFILFIYKE